MSNSDDPLAAMMAGMARGDDAWLWAFDEAFRPKVQSTVVRHLKAMNRGDVLADQDRLAEMVTDAMFVIFDRSSGWKPGGAAPWNWASLAIRSAIAANLGHLTVEIGTDDSLEGEMSGSMAGVADLAIETLNDLSARYPRFGLLAEAFASVGSSRHQSVAWFFRVQKIEGDPSPAVTTAREFGISAANARKIHQRHWSRVSALVHDDDRFAALRGWAWFAA